MKKLFLFLLTAFILTVLSMTQAKASCPTGYTPGSRTFNYNGCYVTVHYCYKTQSLVLDIIVDWLDIPGNCAATIVDWKGLNNMAATYALNGAKEDSYQEDPNRFPPCDEQGYSVCLSVASCIKLSNVLIPDWVCKMEYCQTSAICKNWYYVCHDIAHNKNKLTFRYQETLAGDDCNATQEIPPPPYTWNDPWTTECFNNGCPTPEIF